jgi:quinol monooxygenase YgiN
VDEDTPSTAQQGGDQVSVIMTLRVPGDPDKLERLAGENQDMIRGISQRAKEHGLIAHRFYGSEGQIMVVDEWPDPESFHRFFESEQEAIGPMMEQVATSEPEITFWRKLETGDEVGWE